MSACVEEHDGFVGNPGFNVFSHALDVDETSRGVVVAVFLNAEPTERGNKPKDDFDHPLLLYQVKGSFENLYAHRLESMVTTSGG